MCIRDRWTDKAGLPRYCKTYLCDGGTGEQFDQAATVGVTYTVSYTHLVSLPHGTGKEVRVLVLCTPDAEAAAKEAGADYVGLDEYMKRSKVDGLILM